jgi:hypothetical protein
MPQLLPAYFFRKKFWVASAKVEELLLAMTCTDASGSTLYPPQIFLNGTEVRSCVDTASLQGNETRYFDLTPFAGLLSPGTNQIAVRLGNAWSDYDDIAFDLCLKAIPYQTCTSRLSLTCSNATSPVLLLESPRGSVWQIHSAEALTNNTWQWMETVTNTAGGIQTLRDTGQHSRPPPGSVGQRLYRAVPF